MPNDALTPARLQAIWHVHGLGTIEQMTQPAQGAVNQCWIINDLHVIRFDVIDWNGGINRYAGEKRAYDLLRDSEVPVPEVLVLDDSKRHVPYTYMIMSKLQGQPVGASMAELSTTTQHHIAYTAGQYLATLHSHTFEKFGLLFEIIAGTSLPQWTDFVADFYQDYGQQAVDYGILPLATLERVQAISAKMQPLLATVQQGRFVHGDYHFSNMLQLEGKITGVLDFEWALSGDASWDFRVDDDLEATSEGSKSAFYAGYTSRRALPDHHWERVAYYRIGLYLDYLATFAPHDANETTRLMPLLIQEIEWLERHL